MLPPPPPAAALRIHLPQLVLLPVPVVRAEPDQQLGHGDVGGHLARVEGDAAVGARDERPRRPRALEHHHLGVLRREEVVEARLGARAARAVEQVRRGEVRVDDRLRLREAPAAVEPRDVLVRVASAVDDDGGSGGRAGTGGEDALAVLLALEVRGRVVHHGRLPGWTRHDVVGLVGASGIRRRRAVVGSLGAGRDAASRRRWTRIAAVKWVVATAEVAHNGETGDATASECTGCWLQVADDALWYGDWSRRNDMNQRPDISKRGDLVRER
ncbi:hypothetical protein VTK56DRAFT_3559 [Thermocarpiscus australiensis]